MVEEKPVDPDPEPEEKSTTPDGHTPTGKSSKKSDKKSERGRKSSAKSKAGGRRSSMVTSPPPGIQTPASEVETR